MKLLICVAGAFCLALLCGCAAEAPQDSLGVIEYGQDAAAVTNAHELAIREEISLLERQRAAALDQRQKLLGDAEEYRERSANSWTDPRLTESQRGPEAREYLQLARDLQDQADSYRLRADSINSRISELEAERQNLKHRLNYLKDQEELSP
jgi:hypothetical protein